MNKLKIGMAVMLLAAAVLAAPGGDKTKGADRKGEFHKSLNLTEAQTKQLENDRKASMQTMKENQEKTRKEYKNLFDELSKDNPNDSRVAQIRQNILDLEGKRLDAMIDNATSLKRVLTKEQFEEFERQKSQRGEARKDGQTKKKR